MSRSRWGMIAAGVVVFALVASQILVPAIGERKVVDRLTENGGSADVTLGAVPALRLVWGDGERFAVSARDLDLDLDEPVDVFDRLDGFSIVDVSISSSKAGPVDLESFRLTRDAPAPYHLVSTGTTSAERLVDYGLGGIEVPGETLLDTILGELLDRGPRPARHGADERGRPDPGRLRRRHGRRRADRSACRADHVRGRHPPLVI
jgi:hypothetical protein